jgi:hypothetical protein
METPQEITLSHTTKAEVLLSRFASLCMAVLLKKDWLNIPAITMAISDAYIAIENFRVESGQAVTFTGEVYNSPYLLGDARFEQFARILNEAAGQFGKRVESIGDLAVVRHVPVPAAFRTDADLIAYTRHLESEALEGIRLLRLAAKLTDAFNSGQTTGVFIDIKA